MKQFWGGILLAVGILIAGASGICSLGMLFSGGMGEPMTTLPLVLLFGGPPFAIGFGLAYGGRALIRQARKEREAIDKDVAKTFE
jgi:hypothetical protein